MDPTSPPRPNRFPARRWPWVVATATLVVFGLANVIYPAAEANRLFTAMFGAIIFAFVLVGALLSVRVPNNVIGPMLLGSGAMLAVTVALGTLAIVSATREDPPASIIAAALLVNDIGFVVPMIVVLIGVPLVFPDGHLLSPRWRWIVVLTVAALTAQAVSQVFGPDPIGAQELVNPFAIPALEPVLAALNAFANWTSIIGFTGAVLAVVVRYRRGGEVERHQLKWLIAVAGVAAVAFPVAFIVPLSPVADAAFFSGLLALLALPLAIGIAILRYRLYDIDRIISRTIGWAVVSGLLVAAFAILVVGLQAALAGVTQGDTLAVAASTLVAFALFQPVRRTVQRTVDRRFDRAGYDAQRTADAFAERLRDEVDLDTLAAELERTVVGTMRPSAAALWLPGREP
jgi:hypothetical protein